MAVTVGGTSITFNDATVQSTAAGAPTTAQVLNATAAASVGAVGTYAMLVHSTSSASFTTHYQGTTWAGSALKYSNSSNERSGASPAGTWRLMGTAYAYIGDFYGPQYDSRASVFLRIS